MVYINQVELKNFKSFGGTVKIPLEEGFTVVTGPNGSGKSNILDGILFCLGLATSRGMRADKLPDLVNSGVMRSGKSSETVVSVKFDLSDWEHTSAEDDLERPSDGPWVSHDQAEWTVTRKLRIMPGGSYASTYFSDGEPCNLQQLQTQLRRLHIDPEGSNVVMQGDVTRIVSMSNKDRRELIDELAGVALFDSRIEQTRSKLNDVLDKQERCRIVEQELVASRQKLSKDCEKAKKYKILKEDLQKKKKQENILIFEAAKQELESINFKISELNEKEITDIKAISEMENELISLVNDLKKRQKVIKDLGEDQLISIQSEIAKIDTQLQELKRQSFSFQEQGEKFQEQRKILKGKYEKLNNEKEVTSKSFDLKLLESANERCKDAESAVEVARRRFSDVADRSESWVEKQKNRTVKRQNIKALIEPLKIKKYELEEKLLETNIKFEELINDQKNDIQDNQELKNKITPLAEQEKNISHKIELEDELIKNLKSEVEILMKTRSRMEDEQSKLEKNLARLESRKETIQESRGTGSLKVLLESGLQGIHGPVAQLGQVEEKYRLALEVAAGGRLGQIVVDNDEIAAKAIDLLKRKKAGRLTFLPLNKIRKNFKNQNISLSRPGEKINYLNKDGLIGMAIELIRFEPIYKNVFNYVFGETLVFKNLTTARSQLGIARSVTLDGELLEKSGAMTGGSFLFKSISLGFGTNKDKDDIEPIIIRLKELSEIINSSLIEEDKLKVLIDNSLNKLQEYQQIKVSITSDLDTFGVSSINFEDRNSKRNLRLSELKEIKLINEKLLHEVVLEINPLINDINRINEEEKNLENNNDFINLKQLQNDLEKADLYLDSVRQEKNDLLNEKINNEFHIKSLIEKENILKNEEIRLRELVENLSISYKNWEKQNDELNEKKSSYQIQFKNLEATFGAERKERDIVEAKVVKRRENLQNAKWQLDQLKNEKDSLREQFRSCSIRLTELEKKLPDPLPEMPIEILNDGLISLQNQIDTIQKDMEALEPVNMLALEELQKLEGRLNDLCERLETLDKERSELLLRIETVSTMRQEAFTEAFQSVDFYFREIFASLSEGDGHLQLENKENPLEGGLTLVAHPKGKAVRRLNSMSGGEKSLTALSFLFALQRFRPSPFYALDEVDSFLDGVNVDRLSSLIANQSDAAQFLVVSHRRPMIGASTRTIGVTQARGSHTQVVGLPVAA